MQLNNDTADILIPDGADVEAALSRTTHLGINAHQDDLEIMAYHGILECFGKSDQWFTGVTCTDGAGSPRAGVYADFTGEQMQEVRWEEQRTAARLGKYSAMVQLGYKSSEIKGERQEVAVADVEKILDLTRPEVVYTHNPADKHDSHVATVATVLKAISRLPSQARPRCVYGCEVWRDLDWLPDEYKVVLDVSDKENLAAALLGVFDSQISGGKRYDLATLGRRRANATYLSSHGTDVQSFTTYAMDLSPVVQQEELNALAYVSDLMQKFRDEVTEKMLSLGC